MKVGQETVLTENSLGLIPEQPQDGFTIGRDDASPVGNYRAPNPFSGAIADVRVETSPVDLKSTTKKKRERPFLSGLVTEWGSKVTAENAWREYPRPQMRRDNWTCLNGKWDYAVTPVEQKNFPSTWDGEILVPFCLESKLGGVQRILNASDVLWYRRTFQAKRSERRIKLNFEAVDYRCEVFVNGKTVGTHVGGNLPFSLDITEAVRDGENQLVVRVQDATEEFQLRGKQAIDPKGIWYTQVSGIWQTVWMEEVPHLHLHDLKITTDALAGIVQVTPMTAEHRQVKVEVKEGNRVVAHGIGPESITLTIPNAKLWSPSSPNLYDLEVSLLDKDGKVIDTVHSYTGIRKVGKAKEAAGNWRFTLNGQDLFHWGPLDKVGGLMVC